jgi:hypothetical protein
MNSAASATRWKGRVLTLPKRRPSANYYLSRWFTRATSSHLQLPASSVQPPGLIGVPETLRVLGRLIGTPERLETRLSHTKQTKATRSNRYSSHLPVLPFTNHQSRITSHQSRCLPGALNAAFRVGAEKLPDTANRVETHVTRRKQTIGYASTRHSSRSHNFAASRYLSRSTTRARSSPITSSRFGPRTGIPARGLRAMPEHQLPVTIFSFLFRSASVQ